MTAFTINKLYADTSQLDQLPPGDWTLQMPAPTDIVPVGTCGYGVVPMRATGHAAWFATVTIERQTVEVYGVWREYHLAFCQLLALVMAELFMDVVTPDQMRDLLERMPEQATLDEGRAVTRAWLRDQFGESAVEDPVGYLAALLEHEQAKRSGRAPTVH